MNIREKVAERIQIARKKIGMTQSQLADACGYSRGRLSNWEGASRMPSAQEIYKMAQVLKVSPSWLFGVTDNIAEYETYSGQIIVVPTFTTDDLSKPNILDNLANTEKRMNFLKNYAVVALSPQKKSQFSLKTFALAATDNSMQPEIAESDIIIIDPEVDATPGKYVLASINNEPPILRKYRKPSQNQQELVSINPDWPSQIFNIDDNSLNIIGSVVELRRSF